MSPGKSPSPVLQFLVVFAYRIQERNNECSMMLNGRRLFQQFIVDAYTMIEAERLSYNHKNDKDLRSETYSKLATLAQNSESGVTLRGKKVVLSSSFTGSPRYMMQNYLDAMTICRHYGYPDLFITFTCNPNWPEISRFMDKRGLNSEDRPDVITRVFKIKLDSLMKDLKDGHTFGHVKGIVYTIEFQKRGLPHCHILLWLEDEDKLTTTGKIDHYISTEIPNKDDDPELYQIVSDHMMHGPCGVENPSSPCMVDFKCTKKFPKQSLQHLLYSPATNPGYPGRLVAGDTFPGRHVARDKWNRIARMGFLPGRHRRAHIVSVKQLSATV
ncbi:DNA helicase PIF1, ATP-dependent [Tanacetum coccineum]